MRFSAVAVLAVFLIGCQPSGSASSDAPPVSAAPSQAEPGSDQPPAVSETFTSELHGYSISYPAGWETQPATEPWTASTFPLSFPDPQVDWLSDPDLETSLFLAIASQPIGDATPEDWAAEQMAGDEGCGTTEPITVDGASGLGGCTQAVLTTEGRGYWIQLYTGDEAPPAYDSAWFEEVLATVQLKPEDAVD
jgi:hypothetical protein